MIHYTNQHQNIWRYSCIRGGYVYLIMLENDTLVARDITVSFLNREGGYINDMDLQIPPLERTQVRHAPVGTARLFVDVQDTNPMNVNQVRTCGMEVTLGQRILVSQVLEQGDCGPFS